MAKPTTSYTTPTKPTTSYSVNAADTGGVLLNSSTVTMDSTTVRLTGYTGAVPNQISEKNTTSYSNP